jgi:hypothetical protein
MSAPAAVSDGRRAIESLDRWEIALKQIGFFR